MPRLLEQLEISTPLFLVDAGVPRELVESLVLNFTESFPSHIEIVPPGEPTTERADTYTELLLASHCDGIVAIGGGSTMDLGKAISVLVKVKGEASQYQGLGLITGRGLPVVCIPTTAGSGAEATKSAVLTNENSQVKRGINSVGVLPDAVILEPKFLISLPDRARVASLLDATAHALESYIGRNAWELSTAFSELSFPHLGAHLRFGAGPIDLETAESAILGSFYGGAAICNAETGAVHALAYPLTEFHGIPHGNGVGALLGFVLEFEFDSGDEKLENAAELMGFDSFSALVKNLQKNAATLGLQDQISGFLADPNVRSRLISRTLTLTGAIQNSPHPWDEKKINSFFDFYVAT